MSSRWIFCNAGRITSFWALAWVDAPAAARWALTAASAADRPGPAALAVASVARPLPARTTSCTAVHGATQAASARSAAVGSRVILISAKRIANSH
eukprot:1856485-Alexandrium_andersonii.AAC.1